MRAIVAAGCLMLCTAVSAGSDVALNALSGYWTGTGSITLSSGSTERVKCAVIYKVSGGGAEINQSIRCASTDYSINASADLRVVGDNVSGNWEEKTYSAAGKVSGRYTGSGFVLAIHGDSFTAAMDVSLSACKQSISIAPKGLDVSRIAIGLVKC